MKVLCVLTNKFPYTTVEPYLESEVLHYKAFDKVYIFSLMVKKSEETNRREIPNNISVYPIRNDKIRYILSGIKVFFDINFYRELKVIKERNGINLRRILTLLIYLSRASVDSNRIYELMKNKLENQEIALYSYRFEYQPYTALLVKKKLHMNNALVASRAHGYDLYEERAAGQYIPLRNYLLENLDYIFPCSEAGAIYLKKQYPKWKDKINRRYLGTIDCGIEEFKYAETLFRIVSCSNIVKIKRIDRIIDVLSILDIHNIEWVHFGSGEESEKIHQLAENKLSRSNVNVVFMGRRKNADIMDYYKNNNVNLFLNLSDGEGLPVSIMEAFSFGIPCVATDVGGTSEIIKHGINGFLVNVKETDASIAKTIERIADMDEKEYMRLRDEARNTWRKQFDAEQNYKQFVSDLLDYCISD